MDADVAQWLSDPEKVLIDRDKWPAVPLHAKANVEPQEEWELIAGAMYERNMVGGMEEKDVFHVNGHPVFIGGFGFEKKGKPLEGEVRCTRCI